MNYKTITLNQLDFVIDQIENFRIGPAKDINYSEKFFCFEMVVDEKIFEIPVYLNNMTLGFPHGLHYRFKLIGIGNIDDQRAFSFVPTCLSEKDRNVLNQLTDFILMIPDYILFSMIEKCVTDDFFQYEDLFDLNVLENLDEDEFFKFGITFTETPTGFETSRLSVTRILHSHELEDSFFSLNTISTNPKDVFNFCNKNGFQIDEYEMGEYFNEDSNFWYRVANKKTDSLVGYVRLFMEKHHFPDTLIIQVIVEEKYRGISVGDELINSFKWFLQNHSNVLKIVALLPPDLAFFKKTLDINGFSRIPKNDYGDLDQYEYEVMKLNDEQLHQRISAKTADIQH